jgi:putative PIG3 family NAD(P)H quinone oxidoreductase
MTDSMLAIVLNGHGSADQLQLGTVPRPEPADGQILIEVRAASINRPDIMQREGNYPPPPGESEILGLEVAGIVAAVGANVQQWAPGDRVMALIGGGGYAEYAVAHAGHVMRIPECLDFNHAACVCETYITAYLNLFVIGGFKDQQFALVHGGGGGVTTAAIHLSAALLNDAQLIVTASSGKVDRVRTQGVKYVIDYRTQDFVEVVHEITNNHGVDIVLDHIGAAYLERNMRALSIGGKLVLIGVMGGVKAELQLAHLLVRRQRIVGSVLRPRPRDEKAHIISDFSKVVMPHFDDQTISPLVDAVFPLSEAAKAHQLMESSSHFGKIVLEIK